MLHREIKTNKSYLRRPQILNEDCRISKLEFVQSLSLCVMRAVSSSDVRLQHRNLLSNCACATITHCTALVQQHCSPDHEFVDFKPKKGHINASTTANTWVTKPCTCTDRQRYCTSCAIQLLAVARCGQLQHGWLVSGSCMCCVTLHIHGTRSATTNKSQTLMVHKG